MVKTRKQKFTVTEIVMLVGELEARKSLLCGGHSGARNKRKSNEKKMSLLL